MPSNSGKPPKKTRRPDRVTPSARDMKRGSDIADKAQSSAAKYKNKGDLSHLNDAINFYKNALDSLPTRTARYTDTLIALGQCCLKRHLQSPSSNNLLDLQNSIAHFQEALKRLSRKDSVRYRGCPMTLLQAYYAFYKRKVDDKSREAAVKAYACAIDALTKLEPRLSPIALGALREAFEQQFNLDPAAYGKSYTTNPRGKWSECDESDDAILSLLDVVGRAHLERTVSSVLPIGNRLDHAAYAIGCCDSALEVLAATKGEEYRRIQETRGDSYERRSRIGEHRRKDMDEAILCYESVVQGGNIHSSANVHHTLAVTLHARFHLNGNLADINRAIELDEDVLNYFPSDHPDHACALLNLGKHLLSRFGHNGDIRDVDRAIEIREGWLKSHPPGRVGHKRALGALAAALLSRFKRCGDFADICAVVDFDEKVEQKATLECPKYRVQCLRHLGDSLRLRYEHTLDRRDLEKALEVHQRAYVLASTPDDDAPDTDLNLSYATTLRCHFKRTKNMEHLKQATELFSRTFLREDGNKKDAEHGRHLLTLLECYQDDFGGPTSSSAKEAHRISHEILTIFSEDHPLHAKALTARAICLSLSLQRYVQIIPPDEFRRQTAEIVELFSKASSHAISPSLDRLAAACRWGAEARRWSHESEMQAYVEALRLLDLAIAHGHSLEKQYLDLSGNNIIQTASAIAVDAAALALERGRPALAVRLLEQGRGVIYRQLGHLRAELDDVRVVEPKLAERFAALSKQLDTLAVSESQRTVARLEELDAYNEATTVGAKSRTSNYSHSVSIYRNVLAEWTDVVEQIRKVHGFHSFLQPASFKELLWAANAGPVIVINISRNRSDAIIVLRDLNSPIVVPLPDAPLRDVERLADRLGSRPAKLNKALAVDILRETWTMIGLPVVEKLCDPSLRVPLGSRIWWCATGAASRLPLHAAGPYNKLKSPGIPELFVSSYTPSLGALIRARTSEPGQSTAVRPKMLMVGQPSAEGLVDHLPAATKELQVLRKQAPHATIIEETAGTRDVILQGIAEHEWVHLMCHGNHDPSHPLNSNFSTVDYPLSLLHLLKRDLPRAELAVLSACHSARVNRELPDESLHLAAGMMVAGFRSVVATMWALEDEIAPVVMKRFYDEMLGGNGGPKAVTDAAAALQRAITAEGPDGRPVVPLLQRINFVHYGI